MTSSTMIGDSNSPDLLYRDSRLPYVKFQSIHLSSVIIMIVKIFKPRPGFPGVRYNTNKVDKSKGQLMKVSGFGPLQALSNLRPQDYSNYLKMVSARNTATKMPQFHAVISAKSRSFDKHALVEIAESWLKEMGYGDQPYLLVFHKDTDHNHLHMVSTRIDKGGKRINSAFENMRAISHLNHIIGIDEVYKAKSDLEKALQYNFETKAQLMMVLESWGYKLKPENENLCLIKFGKRLTSVADHIILGEQQKESYNTKRANQITAFLHRYKSQYSAVPEPKMLLLPGGGQKRGDGFRSDLGDFLSDKFGIQLVYHSSPGRPVYGYSVLDHAEGNVFKGSKLVKLAQLIDNLIDQNLSGIGSQKAQQSSVPSFSDSEVSSSSQVPGQFSYEDHTGPDINISIADDVDDQAVLGMKRRRQKKARTNNR